ncbi:MAG: trypsin-like peptidase domain-containing protein, partial [Planctomycetaceae bacterium]|nr:trypsin-like peptidase domain-containing protein [Planctomycetaceae bacterium]
VLTPFDFARMGNDAALGFLRALDGGRTLHVVETAGAAVVRFRVSARSTEHMATVSDQGSGVLVNGGRHVLVAGHVLDIEMEHTDVKYEVFTIDGRLRRGKVPAVRGGVDGAPEGDWGLVELEGEQPVDGPWLRLKPAAAGTTVVLLGYSGGNGVDAAGRVYPSFGLLEAPLRPVAVVGKVKDATLGECEVVAGREVLGGASGGAVIDLRGNLVGIAVTQSWEWRMGEVHQRMNSSWRPILKEGETIPLHDLHVDLGFTFIPVGAFREFLERRWGR